MDLVLELAEDVAGFFAETALAECDVLPALNWDFPDGVAPATIAGLSR
jgi:hypothetical protein